MDIVDGALFFAGLSTIWLAYLVFRASIKPGWPMLLLIVFCAALITCCCRGCIGS